MKRVCAVMGLAVLAMASGCTGKKPTATITFSSQSEPRTPLSEQYMQIAVRNANMTGSTEEYDQEKWSKMTADMIQYYLQQANEKHNIPIKLVDREHVALAQEEKDLAAAGVTDSGDAVASSAIKGVSAIITSTVEIKVDKQVGKKRSINAMSVFGSAWGGGGGASTEQVDEEARNITVQCQFQLKDPATNDIIVSHSTLPTQDFTRTKSSPFFGSSQTEADMNPRDQVIGGFIEKHALDFLAKFVPTESQVTFTVEPSSNENSIKGVRAMVVDDWAGALTLLKQAIVESKNGDDDESLFAAGVCCEKMNQMEDALKYYKQAQSLDPEELKYASAVSRASRSVG